MSSGALLIVLSKCSSRLASASARFSASFSASASFFCASRSSTLPGSADPVVYLPPPFFPRVIRQISSPSVPSSPESSVSSPFSSRIVVVPPPVSVTTPHSCERDVLDGTRERRLPPVSPVARPRALYRCHPKWESRSALASALEYPLAPE